MTDKERYCKATVLREWTERPENLPILPHFTPLQAGSSGSTYGACGIRIDGSSAFIDAVLSHLKELIDGENQVTRLGFSRRPVDGSGIGKTLPNADSDSQCCYIRLHVRGPEGAMASGFFDKHLAAATSRFAVARGALTVDFAAGVRKAKRRAELLAQERR